MAHTHVPGVAAPSTTLLTEREQQRAVDLIESAESSAPYCACGSHMLAVAHGDRIWLECATRHQAKDGLAGVVARVTAWTHTRSVLMELPSA